MEPDERPAPTVWCLPSDVFLGMEFPPREILLAPWLVSSSINMLTAYRGTGKTWAALSIATAVASAGQFLTFEAPAAKQVLYIDGEMPATQLQERLRHVVRMMPDFNPDNLSIISPDIQTKPLPDISTLAGQLELDVWTNKADLIIVDNLSSLARTGVENDAESWTAVASWALRMRREGRAVLFIHHAGKSGQQRGTSKREDLLDTSILLSRPDDAEPGACFTWEWSKARGLHGKDMEPLHAELVTGPTGGLAWTCRADGDVRLAEARMWKAQGKSVREAAKEMGIGSSTVGRLYKRLDGLDA